MEVLRNMRSLFANDEDLGKKDDDHKSINAQLKLPHWSPARPPPRKTTKRILITLVIGLIVFVFIRNIPTDVPIRDRRRPNYEHKVKARPPRPMETKHKPAQEQTLEHTVTVTAPVTKTTTDVNTDADETIKSVYSGPIRFPNLRASLEAISNTGGSMTPNKNVLFAAASLKSAASLLPLACLMASELRNYVHFALMSRSDIDLDDLLAINGIGDSCQIIMHDARPDYSTVSIEARLELGANRALHHVYTYMHPQAVIVDGSISEETYFLKGITSQAVELTIPLIQLPENGLKRLTWITKLDSSSLSAWHRATVDIAVHASTGASGSLVRLLKSLSAADLTGCAVPHLTVELPNKVDAPTTRYLNSFQWPPRGHANPSGTSQLSVRHRINRKHSNEADSAVRFLESFWPSNPDSHVLVLSPQAELSPQFLPYLKYAILEYKYSDIAIMQEWDARLMGISLDLPSSHINASQPFSPPTKKDASSFTDDMTDGPIPFLWQTPNSNAVLYFGQKWIELHSFVSKMIDSPRDDDVLPTKVVSKRYPAWLEHALTLSRARGYWTLYPSARTASNLAAVHDELYKAPEEFESYFEKKLEEVAEIKLDTRPLIESLPNAGTLPPFDEMPLLSWDGEVTNLRKFDRVATSYTADFRRGIGGCERLTAEHLLVKTSAADLFCIMDD